MSNLGNDVVLWIGKYPPLPAQMRDLSKLGALEIHVGMPKSAEDVWRSHILPNLDGRRVYVVLVAPLQYKMHLLSRIRGRDDVVLLEVLREKIHEGTDFRECGYVLQELDREKCWIAHSQNHCAVYCYRGLAILREIKQVLIRMAL